MKTTCSFTKSTHTVTCVSLLFSADNGSMSTISSGPQNQQPFEVSNWFFTQTSYCQHFLKLFPLTFLLLSRIKKMNWTWLKLSCVWHFFCRHHSITFGRISSRIIRLKLTLSSWRCFSLMDSVWKCCNVGSIYYWKTFHCKIPGLWQYCYLSEKGNTSTCSLWHFHSGVLYLTMNSF